MDMFGAWSGTEWIPSLVSSIVRKPPEVCQPIEDQTGSPTEVKVDIITLSKDIEEGNRQSFRSGTIPMGETPRQTLLRLDEAAQKWLRPKDRTKSQIVDIVVLEQFLQVLPLGMQAWVRAKEPSTSEEAAQLAEAYLGHKVKCSPLLKC